MNINEIRQLLSNLPADQAGRSVVVVEVGQKPLLVRELGSTREADSSPQEEPSAEVPISSVWPKGRSIHERSQQDSVLERLNKEILSLREQIAAEDGQSAPGQGSN